MRCPACGCQVTFRAEYCSRCGSRLGKSALPSAVRDEEEVTIWEGRYSWKGMIQEFLVCGLATILAFGIGPSVIQDASTWRTLMVFLGCLWVILLLTLALRKLRTRYRLTSRHLYRDDGILRRISDRLEIIDIDDVRVEQSLVEVVVRVGQIRLRTSDHTDPHLSLRGIGRAQEVAQLIDEARRRERDARGIPVKSI